VWNRKQECVYSLAAMRILKQECVYSLAAMRILKPQPWKMQEIMN
jgi:hypothetical protein